MVNGRPKGTGTDLEGEFSDSNLKPIMLETRDVMDTDAGPLRSRLTAEDLQSAGWPNADPATWTRSFNPLFIVVAEASYP